MLDREAAERVGALLDGAVLDGGDRAPMRVLHGRVLSPADPAATLGHVVISVAGIFLIDAVNCTGDRTVREGQVVRALAARMTRMIGRTVTPVLCLVGDEADLFGEPTVVREVNVVPISRLLTWLAQLPAVMAPEQVATRAVDLSMRFPPAVDAGLTLHSLVESPMSITPHRHRSRRSHRVYPGGAGAADPQRRSPRFPVRLIVLLVLGVALFVVGTKVLSTLSRTGVPATTTSRGPR